MSHSKVSSALEPYLKEYGGNAGRVRHDIQQMQHRFSNMIPTGDTFVENTGVTRSLLKFVGTVPIVYRGQTYHIPLTIWLPPTYPFVQPNIYVTPTADMAIKPQHQHVDTEGKCYLPALSQWNAGHSSLVSVVGELQGAFAVRPPVYAKPRGQAAVRAPSNPYGVASPSSYQPPSSAGAASAYQSSSGPGSSQPARHNPIEDASRKQVTARVAKECQEVAEQMTDFMRTQQRLESGAGDIEETIRKMSEHRRQLHAAIEWTQQATRRLEDERRAQEARGGEAEEVDVDQIVISNNAMGQQLLEAVAMNKALDDAIYCLNKAMYSDDVEIDCHTFTKQMRKLSSEQFLQLALIRKIHALNRHH